ncbi:hypothetical protein MGU_06742 [Metarhizium guizhouense ARSEF 977]|uniref:Uncharacterized protein n=1 Tax=Metarhizium guizhouense (strain ARSEF 977) TaxID=1276136 RepID=A0A0B4GGC9_METGA|nr:hypothetical protein MGU_06742 [Metarhizium guizhouense ARSEF 977]
MNYSKVFPRFVSRLLLATLLASAFLLLAFNADMLYLSRWQKHARYGIADGIHARFRRDFSEGVEVKYTTEWLQKQFTNPQGIASILLLIGGDIIQKAIAQLACNAPPSVPYFTPVIFSYGWVSYAFISVANAFGSADYFPKPDYPATVVTVASGDRRENQSWIIGRLLRDLEREIDPTGDITNRAAKGGERPHALHIAAFVIDPKIGATFEHKRDRVWWSFVYFLILQLFVAVCPLIPYPTRKSSNPNFYILIITVIGNLLAVLTGAVHTSKIQKFGNGRCDSKTPYIITRGNGHNIAIVVLPNSFDNEEMEHGQAVPKAASRLPYFDRLAAASYRPSNTRAVLTMILAFAWVALLLMIGGSTEDSWFLLLVGAIGMAHNVYVASAARTSEAHGIPLKRLRGHWEFWGTNVIGTLLRLEKTIPGAGYMLRPLFFTGPETELDYNAWFETFAAPTDRTRNGVLAEREILKKIKERKERWRNLFQDDFKPSHGDPFKCWMKIGAEAKRQEKKAKSWDGKTVTITYPFLESLGEHQTNAASTKDTEVDEDPSGNSSKESGVHVQGDSRSPVGMGESSTAIFRPQSSISKSTPKEDIQRPVKPLIVGVGETKKIQSTTSDHGQDAKSALSPGKRQAKPDRPPQEDNCSSADLLSAAEKQKVDDETRGKSPTASSNSVQDLNVVCSKGF